MHMPSNATRVRMPFSNVFKPLTFHAAVNFDARAGRRQHVRCHGCSAREAGFPMQEPVNQHRQGSNTRSACIGHPLQMSCAILGSSGPASRYDGADPLRQRQDL